MQSVNPATGEAIREYDERSPSDVEVALQACQTAFSEWRTRSVAERARLMHRVAAELRQSKPELARLVTLEMGKPIAGSEAEIDKCAEACEYYADNAERLLRPERIESDATESFVRFDPLGPVLAIMPWNFPFWQVFRFAAPTLMAGNVGVLKHASNVPGCALAIEDVFKSAGFPQGVFTTLLVSAKSIEPLIAHPAIVAVTLTGSEGAGRAVARAAGQHIKKTVLELGGSDPFIVLADADLDEAVSDAVKARIINSGQSCIAAKRFIVEKDVFDEFASRFVARMRELITGDPLDRATDVGPLARADLVDELHGQVTESRKQGAKLLLGGERLDRAGYFYAPTVLGEVAPGMSAFVEETFGPVAALSRADDPDHALLLANQSRFGLGASIWSGDRGLCKRLAGRIDAGAVFINGIVKSDPRLPFGGVKASGFGRELGSFGIREFVNIKTVWMA